MRLYRQLVADLLVGDYLRVVSQVPNEDQRPGCFRRVEKIEYIEAPQTSSSPTVSTTSSRKRPSGGGHRQAPRLICQRCFAAMADSRCVRTSGMTSSVRPVRDFQPHSQLALRRPVPAGRALTTVTLCPATC